MKPRQDLQLNAVPGAPAAHDGADQGRDSSPASTPHRQWSRPARLAGTTLRVMMQVALPAAVLAGALAIYSYMKATRPEVAKRLAREATYAVRSVPVRFRSVVPTLQLYGTTIAGRQVDLRSLVAGRVAETGAGLRDGGEVAKGEMLLRLDPFDFEVRLRESRAQFAEAEAKLAEMKASLGAEQSNLEFAREQLKLAQTDLERATPLARRGAVSARTVDERRLIAVQRRQAVKRSVDTIAVWQARLAQQMAAIERLKTSIAQAEQRRRETVLGAPFNSYVMNVEAQVGRLMNVNDRVATLIDRDWIDVRFTLSNAQYGRMADGAETVRGRDVKVVWNVGPRALKYHAKIERIGAQVNSASGGVDVYARIATPSRPVPIRPGVFVEVTVPDARFDDVATLPSTAVYGGSQVYVVRQGRLQARTITVVGTDGNDLLVRGALKDGERVLASRLSTPGDGVRVEEQGRHGNGA